MQWDGTPDKAEELIKAFNCLVPPNMPALSIVTQYGMLKGDWMCTHTAGQQIHVYVVKQDTFRNKYKPYEEETQVKVKPVKQVKGSV